ncbi:RNA 2'-phosphotransferase [Massilia sp. W12]|uniref:RNA 2'-phosphotransferase n=1 Tax=Massilia sp. W12 TaxID=3126507 RepID=UPI0030D44450
MTKFSEKTTLDVSRFLSFILRHQPESIGVQLDSDGWTDVEALLAKAARHGHTISHELLLHVVQSNDKRRFTLSPEGDKIRAAQGHSSKQVNLQYAPQIPPPQLFHGTASRFVASILRQGLRPGQRQHVHLSSELKTAKAVGARHGAPVIFAVDAAAAHAAGIAFYQADNGVWLCGPLPAQYLRQLD